MKYIVKKMAFNVLNEQLPDVILSKDENNKIDFASYFESFKYPIEFDSQDQAFSALSEFLNLYEFEKYFFDHETGDIFKQIGANEIYKTGFKIRESK
jgi:hypothetical protein